MVWALCVPLVLLYLFCGRHLMGFFLESPTELALDSGIAFLRILSPFYFVVSSKLVADGILRGAGMMRQFMIATFTDLILRVVMAFLLSGTVLGYTGIWCAWPIGWTVATVLSIAFYRGCAWNRKEGPLQTADIGEAIHDRFLLFCFAGYTAGTVAGRVKFSELIRGILNTGISGRDIFFRRISKWNRL